MTNIIVTPSPEPRSSIGIFAGQLFAAALLTAVVGALSNTLYERFLDREAYNAGPVFARATFAFAVTFPFILAGLFFIGLPATYALRRLKLDNLLAHTLVGAVAGASVGSVTASGNTRLQMLFAAYGSLSAVVFWALQRRRA